ncbi:unnamed protein product [Pedinophyceae sp. YPF-701]|nr:unnamed protein product [Pedinophyceae sp. YPF-701]
MPRELVTIQVGQCGNQIGTRFWELALREHAHYNPRGLFDEPISSFFRNTDDRYNPPKELEVGDGTGRIRTLKARAVVVDMEEGVVNGMLSGKLGTLFDDRQMLTDVSGSGNNWAHGFNVYGPQYREGLLETVRAAAERCDSLQSFLMMHSLGGGTGSGVGSYLLEALADEYPEVYRFNCSVFPSKDDDVITSPYNAALSLAKLAEHADCVLPVENQALMDVVENIAARGTGRVRAGSTADGVAAGATGEKPWDRMNGIAANLLLNLTSSVRFEGQLNVDLNEITMNLVPFPRMHFLMGAMSPLAAPADVGRAAAPRAVDQVFGEVLQSQNQLIKADPRASTCLACGLLLRGDVAISDVSRCVASRIRPALKMAHWNGDGFKIGMCSKPPVGLNYSLLALQNNCAIRSTFQAMSDRAFTLYKRGVYLHHYTQYIDEGVFGEAFEALRGLADGYAALDGMQPPQRIPRLRPIGLGFA